MAFASRPSVAVLIKRYLSTVAAAAAATAASYTSITPMNLSSPLTDWFRAAEPS